MTDTLQLIAAVVSVLFGAGGIAALWRTRGQNHTDTIKTLSEAEAKFRQDQAAAIARLETRLDQQDKRNDALEAENRELNNRVNTLERENTDLHRQLDAVSLTLVEAQKQIAALTLRLEHAEAARADAVQRVQVAEATTELLRRENVALRERLISATATPAAGLAAAVTPSADPAALSAASAD